VREILNQINHKDFMGNIILSTIPRTFFPTLRAGKKHSGRTGKGNNLLKYELFTSSSRYLRENLLFTDSTLLVTDGCSNTKSRIG
jgi:hypothetical protein